MSQALLLRERGDFRAAEQLMDAVWKASGELGPRCPGLFERFSLSINLTPREREIIRMIVQGATPTVVADSLGLSHRTVETHIHTAYHKVGVRSRREISEALDTWLVM